jgi:hypothetical protein
VDTPRRAILTARERAVLRAAPQLRAQEAALNLSPRRFASRPPKFRSRIAIRPCLLGLLAAPAVPADEDLLGVEDFRQ